VVEVAAWFADREDLYRQAGMVGARRGAATDAQGDLLAAFGRDPTWGVNHAAMARFAAAFGAGDVDRIMALMTEDCVLEATGPAPDGERHEGAAAVRAVWTKFFGRPAGAAFTEEESFVSGDRGVLRWRCDWVDPGRSRAHVRGVDVLRFRDGLVCEKFSYVKG
jgi:ketosteroid isomerase-like protein